MPAELAGCPVCLVPLAMPGPDAPPDPEHHPTGLRATCDACGSTWPTRSWVWLPLPAAGVGR